MRKANCAYVQDANRLLIETTYPHEIAKSRKK